ncbi:PREDICTED: lysine-rich arabinogalactan protein 19-like [Ceratotherium simum simum]|uniref:Lysine-rich arabinogalactan protein 19-like n=1 Tax=Ceratotherium simum simum TaxID=73337 RepID=A0ABM1DBS4_CERSS|nr:PREDICTED: lysine-rich arabinogalactan protein 19-like [Ceratotherium simum simum]
MPAPPGPGTPSSVRKGRAMREASTGPGLLRQRAAASRLHRAAHRASGDREGPGKRRPTSQYGESPQSQGAASPAALSQRAQRLRRPVPLRQPLAVPWPVPPAYAADRAAAASQLCPGAERGSTASSRAAALPVTVSFVAGPPKSPVPAPFNPTDTCASSPFLLFSFPPSLASFYAQTIAASVAAAETSFKEARRSCSAAGAGRPGAAHAPPSALVALSLAASRAPPPAPHPFSRLLAPCLPPRVSCAGSHPPAPRPGPSWGGVRPRRAGFGLLGLAGGMESATRNPGLPRARRGRG